MNTFLSLFLWLFVHRRYKVDLWEFHEITLLYAWIAHKIHNESHEYNFYTQTEFLAQATAVSLASGLDQLLWAARGCCRLLDGQDTLLPSVVTNSYSANRQTSHKQMLWVTEHLGRKWGADLPMRRPLSCMGRADGCGVQGWEVRNAQAVTGKVHTGASCDRWPHPALRKTDTEKSFYTYHLSQGPCCKLHTEL